MEDEQIIQLFFDRSERAITEVQNKYGAYCSRIAGNILPSPEDCEECVSDVWWRLWTTIPPQRPARLRAFLGAVTRNFALSRYRALHAEKRGGGMEAEALSELETCVSAGLEEVLEEKRLVALLNSFLEGLSRENRIIFVKRYWYLSSVDQIARELGCTEGKVKMSLHRTRKQLKRRLEKEEIDL